jgi:catechol 2,3-dioxygenase-like lactoylglutathione lyase family enzyme
MSDALNPTLVVVTLPVDDLVAATAWYTNVLGRGPMGEPSPTDVEFELRDGVSLLLTSGDDVAAGTGCKVLLGVENLAAEQARLNSLGVGTGDREEIEGALAWCDFTSPEGHQLSLVEALS